jgi:hypothetical protein
MPLLLSPLPGHASLGGTVADVEKDRQALSASALNTKAEARYVVHELPHPGGVVHEYQNSNGKVFAVTSTGSLPNLEQLLGSYTSAYQNALRLNRGKKSALRQPLVIRTDHLVFIQEGHPKAWHVRAYDPSLKPENVSEGELK